jgi:hypothetical protein
MALKKSLFGAALLTLGVGMMLPSFALVNNGPASDTTATSTATLSATVAPVFQVVLNDHDGLTTILNATIGVNAYNGTGIPDAFKLTGSVNTNAGGAKVSISDITGTANTLTLKDATTHSFPANVTVSTVGGFAVPVNGGPASLTFSSPAAIDVKATVPGSLSFASVPAGSYSDVVTVSATSL